MAEQGQNRPRNKNVFYVGLLSFFGGISQDVFAPILPIYLTSVLGFDKTFVGIAEGIVAATFNIFKILAGWLSDKFKKQKPIIFIGYFLSMISRPLLAFVGSAAPVFSLRFLDGVGKGLKDPPKDILIAGSAKKEIRGKSFGIARMLDTLGSVAGPLILFGLLYILKDSASLYHKILIFSAAPLIITLFIAVIKLKEIPKAEIADENKAVYIANSTKLPSSFYIFLIIVAIFSIGNSSDAFLILRAKNLGATLLEIPIFIALFNLIYAMGAVPFGSLSDRIGRIPTMLMGWLAYSAVYFGFAITSKAIWIWVLYGAYGIYYAISEGVARAFVADIIESGHRGRAFGFYGATVGFTGLAASFLAGFLWDKIGPQAPFYFGAVISLFAAILLFIFMSTHQEKS